MFNQRLNFLQRIKSLFFPFYNNKDLKYLFEKLQEGFPKEKVVARFVGGCVRKHLSDEKIDDIDIATILTSDEIKQRLKDTKFQVIDTGIKHGTVTVVSKNCKAELTTLRKDIKTDGRHAEVEYTDDWKLDSERRDFTINSIYLDIDGKIYDPQMGTEDLKNNNVKFIGDPQKRIEEDYLRIIRFIRFKIMYDLNIESTTSDAIKQNLDGIKKISKERILIELLKILELKNIFKINESTKLKEIFSVIFPEFLYLKRLERLKKIYDVTRMNKEILLAALLIDEKDNHEYFAHKYNIASKLKKSLENLAQNLKNLKKDKNFLEKDLIKNIYIYGKNHLIALILINFSMNAKINAQEFSKNLNKILKTNIPKFHINGDYLKKNGMVEGEALGKVLNAIEKEWIDNSFSISKNRIVEIIKANSN